MRERGWKDFRLTELFGRPVTGRHKPTAGMIETFGWNEIIAEPAETIPTFKQWLIETKADWNWDWPYQKYIYERLARLDRGEIDRLMVFMPPRHGKSELVTIRYAAWVLIMRPQTRIVIASYNQKLANKFSRSIRRIVLEARNRQLTMGNGQFEAKARSAQTIDRLLNTASEWETPEGGGVKAVGVGAGITGFGADLIIIDDPIKGRADAESKNNRAYVWEWYSDDLHTRLEPRGSVILIQTRWHQDDLAGRLLNEQESGGEKWEVIKLPALAEQRSGDTLVPTDAQASENSVAASGDEDKSVLAPFDPARLARASENSVAASGDEDKSVLAPFDPLGRLPGEALCPARFDREALLAKKRKLGSYSFSALYQQDPVPADGNVFKRAWFTKIVERAPDGLRWFRAYDLAISTKTSADYTASARLAQDKDGTIYIADIFRKRIEYPEQLRYITGRIDEERDTEHGIESALHGTAFVQELRRNARLSSRAFRAIHVDKDKLTRCLAWANRAEEGKVVLVRGPWIADFIDEACAFPNGRHDDQIDAVSLAVEMVTRRKHVAFSF